MGRFDDLPIEIIPEILIRLPTESVLECKLVCKPWRDLVHHPFFSQMHLNHHLDSADDSGKLSFVFITYIMGRIDFSYTEYDENCHETPFSRKTRMDIRLPCMDSFVGSYNGLICFRSNSGIDSYIICNPITREYIMLPKVEGMGSGVGFGYSLSTNEYKVVRICYKGNTTIGIPQVYTLGSSNGWRNVGTMDVDMKHVKQYGVFANGSLHWVNHQQGAILAFHLTDETYYEIPSPPCLARTRVPESSITLGMLRNFLSVTYYPSGGESHIWFRKKNKDNNDFKWKQQFCFNSYITPPFGYTKSGELLWSRSSGIYSYHQKTCSAKTMVSFVKHIYEVIPHKNTLVSLRVLGEKDIKTMESGERKFKR